MKVILMILLFLPACLFAQWPGKSKAKIKLVTTYGFNPEQNTSPKNTKHWIQRFVFRFDTVGRIMWFYISSKRTNKPNDTIRITYDKEGRELKSGSSNYSYSYNKQNNLVIRDLNVKNSPVFKIINSKDGIDTLFNNDTSISVMKYNPEKTVFNTTRFDKHGVLQSQSIQIRDDQDRIIDEIEIKDGARQSRRLSKYEKYGYTVIDSTQMTVGESLRTNVRTYKYVSFDKYDNPLIISVLYNGEYVVDRKNEYEYY